ncbi:MAG: hypothetical protein U9Q82_15020, partial [Chloroflexota bacterium]|nr:hypothetical protein [Chloroflexota bacterium]
GWLELQTPPIEGNLRAVTQYLEIIRQAANALTILTNGPLTERRFLTDFAESTQALERPEMYAGLLGLLGSPQVEVSTLHDWVVDWEKDFNAIPASERPIQLHLYRRNYYLRAFEVQLNSNRPKNVLWPLLKTWLLTASSTTTNWHDVYHQVGLLGPAFSERISELDLYLEQVEEIIETWAREHGA